MLSGLCFILGSQIWSWSQVWLCKQWYWHHCRAGSSIPPKVAMGVSRSWNHICEALRLPSCHWHAPADFFFSCFVQTSSLPLRYEISFESFVGFGKITHSNVGGFMQTVSLLMVLAVSVPFEALSLRHCLFVFLSSAQERSSFFIASFACSLFTWEAAVQVEEILWQRWLK